jgi:hypothetical protein
VYERLYVFYLALDGKCSRVGTLTPTAAVIGVDRKMGFQETCMIREAKRARPQCTGNMKYRWPVSCFVIGNFCPVF